MWFLGLDIGFDQGFWAFGRFYTVRAARIPLYLLSGNPKPIIMGLCYFGVMKTTVEIEDQLFADLKAECARHGMSLKSALEKALHTQLREMRANAPWDPYADFSVDGGGVHPWLAHLDMNTVINMSDEEVEEAKRAWPGH